MTTTDPALPVPDAACDALHACTGRERADVRAIAAPVVAAELREQAAQVRYHRTTTQDARARAELWAAALRLDLRADQLDPTS